MSLSERELRVLDAVERDLAGIPDQIGGPLRLRLRRIAGSRRGARSRRALLPAAGFTLIFAGLVQSGTTGTICAVIGFLLVVQAAAVVLTRIRNRGLEQASSRNRKEHLGLVSLVLGFRRYVPGPDQR